MTDSLKQSKKNDPDEILKSDANKSNRSNVKVGAGDSPYSETHLKSLL